MGPQARDRGWTLRGRATRLRACAAWTSPLRPARPDPVCRPRAGRLFGLPPSRPAGHPPCPASRHRGAGAAGRPEFRRGGDPASSRSPNRSSARETPERPAISPSYVDSGRRESGGVKAFQHQSTPRGGGRHLHPRADPAVAQKHRRSGLSIHGAMEAAHQHRAATWRAGQRERPRRRRASFAERAPRPRRQRPTRSARPAQVGFHRRLARVRPARRAGSRRHRPRIIAARGEGFLRPRLVGLRFLPPQSPTRRANSCRPTRRNAAPAGCGAQHPARDGPPAALIAAS